jgi:hypothetical protein
MSSLPNCPVKNGNSYCLSRNDPESLTTVPDEIVNYLGGECYALLVNNEVIFNSYDQMHSLRDNIIEDIIHDTLLRPSQINRLILKKIEKMNVDSTIEIYMNPLHDSWKVRIDYNSKEKTYTFTKAYTEGYVKKKEMDQ